MSDFIDPKHTGEAPARRPPEDEPERVGEGELDETSPPPAGKRVSDESGEDEDLLGED